MGARDLVEVGSSFLLVLDAEPLAMMAERHDLGSLERTVHWHPTSCSKKQHFKAEMQIAVGLDTLGTGGGRWTLT